MVDQPTQESAGRGISRGALLEAAATLFAERGYRATTLDDIAGALSIKKASLYHYIAGKEDLLVGIYERIFDRIEAAVLPWAEADLPADERLRRMVHRHVEVVASESAMLAVVFREEAELAAANRMTFSRRKAAYERAFEKTFAAGMRDGVIRGLSPLTMARATLGMCNWLYQWYRPGRDDWEQIAAELTLMLESGWLADGSGRRGAFERSQSVHEAIEPARDALTRAREQLDEVSVALTRAADRLRDGLASSEERR